MEVLAQELNKDTFRSPNSERVLSRVEAIPRRPGPFGCRAAVIALEGKAVPKAVP